MCLKWIRTAGFVVIILAAGTGFAQSEVQKRTLIVNGHSAETIVYRIDGRVFVSLEALVQIGNGSLSFRGSEIVVVLPATPERQSSEAGVRPVDVGMSSDFMKSAIQNLAVIKDWHTMLAHFIQHGVPGDGSRLVVFHDRAAEGLRLASVAAANSSDQSALQLLRNHFKQVDIWTRKLVQERKSMSTANYSVTPNALESDAQYQQIASCSKFLGTMFASGRYDDDGSCR